MLFAHPYFWDYSYYCGAVLALTWALNIPSNISFKMHPVEPATPADAPPVASAGVAGASGGGGDAVFGMVPRVTLVPNVSPPKSVVPNVCKVKTCQDVFFKFPKITN